MNNLWFFGDSFCAHKKNWVTYLRDIRGYNEIKNLGSEGTSLQFLIYDLLKKKNQIDKTDGVVICLTDIGRDFFKGKNFMPTIIDNHGTHIKDDESWPVCIETITKDEQESYKMYLLNLVIDNNSDNFLFHDSFLFNKELQLKFIFDDIISNLKTKKIAIIACFESTHNIIKKTNFIKNKKLYKGSTTFKEIADFACLRHSLNFSEEYVSPNHFVNGDKKYMDLIMSSFKENFENI